MNVLVHVSIVVYKGGMGMAALWLKTIGFLIILFSTLGVYIYFLRVSLNSEDASIIDPIPDKKQ